jgi:isovaleryl-CoA dehydrogenase
MIRRQILRSALRASSAQFASSGFNASLPVFVQSRSKHTAHKTKHVSLFDPTEEHAQLRQMVRNFVKSEVDQQALEFNRLEQFNRPLFNKLGELGLLGVTAGTEYGGSGV